MGTNLVGGSSAIKRSFSIDNYLSNQQTRNLIKARAFKKKHQGAKVAADELETKTKLLDLHFTLLQHYKQEANQELCPWRIGLTSLCSEA
jgi:hypothetical protein